VEAGKPLSLIHNLYGGFEIHEEGQWRVSAGDRYFYPFGMLRVFS
jgi:hypothetical protein